jgi:hypothetical protein
MILRILRKITRPSYVLLDDGYHNSCSSRKTYSWAGYHPDDLEGLPAGLRLNVCGELNELLTKQPKCTAQQNRKLDMNPKTILTEDGWDEVAPDCKGKELRRAWLFYSSLEDDDFDFRCKGMP